MTKLSWYLSPGLVKSLEKATPKQIKKLGKVIKNIMKEYE